MPDWFSRPSGSFAWTAFGSLRSGSCFFVLHPEKIGCVGCISSILQVNIDVKRHRRTWWGSYIKPTHCATKIRKNIALIILLSIFGFIDQPYKSKTYPTQPSKNQHMPMTPFSLTAIMFRWWNMIAGQVTSNDWGSRIKLGREVKCLVFVLCFLQTVFS